MTSFFSSSVFGNEGGRKQGENRIRYAPQDLTFRLRDVSATSRTHSTTSRGSFSEEWNKYKYVYITHFRHPLGYRSNYTALSYIFF